MAAVMPTPHTPWAMANDEPGRWMAFGENWAVLACWPLHMLYSRYL